MGVVCLECGKEFKKVLSWQHLLTHDLSVALYKMKHPGASTIDPRLATARTRAIVARSKLPEVREASSRRMVAYNKSDAGRQRARETMQLLNLVKTREVNSAAAKKSWTNERRRMQSLLTSQQLKKLWRDSPEVFRDGRKRGWFEYKGTFYRSQGEVRFAFYLAATEFWYEEIPIEYEFGGRQRIYVPDFFLPCQQTFIEIKYDKIKDIDDAKFSAVRDLGFKLIVIFKSDLDDLGVPKYKEIVSETE